MNSSKREQRNTLLAGIGLCLLALLFSFLAGCGGETARPVPPPVIVTPPPAIEIPPPPPVVPQAVMAGGAPIMIGDSLIARWPVEQPDLWPATTYSAAVGGQTTWQMAVRFEAAVLPGHPAIVVIEGGVNDLYYNGAYDPWPLISMVQRAQAAGACVVLVSFIPGDVPQDMGPLNIQREAIAMAYGAHFVNVYPDLLDSSGHGLAPGLHVGDGFHLSRAGYEILAPAVVAGMEECLP